MKTNQHVLSYQAICLLFLILTCIFPFSTLWAQSPEKMSYQAVIRNAGGQLVTSQSIGIRVQILQSSEFGAAVYVETHTRPTNANGLVTLGIGEGTVVTGSFSGINWSAGPYFLKTEIDPTGGTSYSIIGTTQLLSVPYALHAKESNNLKGSITESQISDLKNYLTSETDPVFNASPAQGITGSNITNWNTAFGWGNHTGMYRPISYMPAWGEITSKPSTLGGYGISDAMGTSHPANAISGTNITNWNTAFGWGNHSGLYRTVSWVPAWNDVTGKPSFSIVATSGSYNDLLNLPALNITNWNTAYGWGNHSGLYRPVSWVPSWTDVTAKPTTFTPSAHSHSAVDIISGTLAVTRGGSGFSSYTVGNYIRASGATTLEQRTPAQVLADIGAAPTSHNHSAADITAGTLPVARGGTGTTTFTSGNVLIGSGTGAITTMSRSGIDSRATFPPAAHTHGNITNTGSIGSTAGRIVTTGSGGTLQATAGTATGQMLYWNGSSWINVAPGSSGQILTLVNGVPKWTGTSASSTDVVNPITGRIWMDRNLGAIQVATSSTDANSYGHLYQWGRRTDWHQVRTSGTTSTLSSSDTPGHANFILATSIPYDWRSPQNTNLWQGVSGVNNPCPSGYRLPTEAEWNAERLSWSSNNSAGAFASSLKLPVAGSRSDRVGSLRWVGYDGCYWSSTVAGALSQYLHFHESIAGMYGDYRSCGYSVRCLKD